MRLGFCSIVERDSPARVLRRIVAGLREVGVHLPNPDTHLVTALIADGTQVVTSPQALLDQVGLEEEVTFQLWFSGDTDIDCWLVLLGDGLVRHNYSLDGLNPGERHTVVSWAARYFRSACADGTAALCVIDPSGATADVDWDAIATGQPLPPMLPQLLGLPVGRLSDVTVGHDSIVERLGEMALVSQLAN
jgi:hypothetical protein